MGKYGIIPGSKEDVFGFDPGKGRFEQLKEVLQMKKKEDVDNLWDEINRLTRKHLDLNAKLNTRFQRASLDKLEKELLDKRPDIWGGKQSDRKLYFARRVAMTIHWKKNHDFFGKKREDVEKEIPGTSCERPLATGLRFGTGFSSDLSDLEDSDEETDSLASPAKSSKQTEKAHATASHIGFNPSHTRPQNVPEMKSSNSDTIIVRPIPRKRRVLPFSPNHKLERPKIIKEEKDCASGSGSGRIEDPIIIEDDNEDFILSQADSPPMPPEGFNEANVTSGWDTFIGRFLSACKPPMVKHLRLFEEFGGPHADWEITLRSLSLEWPAQNRQDLLRQILSGVEKNKPVMELDIAILENHFKTYFS